MGQTQQTQQATDTADDRHGRAGQGMSGIAGNRQKRVGWDAAVECDSRGRLLEEQPWQYSC